MVVLAVVSVGLFTGYFREGTAGPLHGAQSGVGGVIAPLQSFASKAVQPVRDGWGWLTSLVDLSRHQMILKLLPSTFERMLGVEFHDAPGVAAPSLG